MTVRTHHDQKALARIGEQVRRRLAADPSVYKVPVERAEIFAVTDFLSAEECDHLIAMIDSVARPSELFAENYRDGYRSSYSGDVDGGDSFVRMIERRLSDLLGIHLEWGERFQGQRYRAGQEFKEHCDWFDCRARYWDSEESRGGQPPELFAAAIAAATAAAVIIERASICFLPGDRSDFDDLGTCACCAGTKA